MVANDKINAFALGISYFFHSLYATIKHYYQFHTDALGIVYALQRYTIALIIARGDIVLHV